MIKHFVEQGSSYAADIDNVILLIAVTVGFFFLLAQAIFFGLIFRFSARDGVKAKYVAGEGWKEKRWISIPHYSVLVFDILILVAAVRVWIDVKQTTPPVDEVVRVIAQQWAWTFVHAGPDGKLDTPDDIRTVDELHVQVNRTYEFELQARDTIHSFSVPVFRLKQDAIPGRTIKGWFKPIITGGYDIQCAEICGIGHAMMSARVIISQPEAHAEWVKTHAPLAGATK